MYKTKEQLTELQEQYAKGNIAPTEKELLQVNPLLAYEVKDKDILESIPFDSLRKLENVYGKVSRFSQYTPVKNLKWDYFFFINSDLFRPAGVAFQKSAQAVKGSKIKPSYTKHLAGTKAYKDFWEEEYRRIKLGYEPEIDGKGCGIRIGGEFYFYLNYGWIKKLEFNDDGEVKSDKSDLPDFLAMDYYYYRELEARENPAQYNLPRAYKQSLSVVKSRRKGFEQPFSSLLYTSSGTITMGEIRVGDKVYGPNGKLIEVTNIYPQGVKDVYEVALLDGRKIKCGANHLWEVNTRVSRGKRKTSVIRTCDLGELKDKVKGYNYYIRPSEAVPYEHKSLPLAPYIVGSMLGDGNLTKQFKFTTGDEESLSRILVLLNEQFDNRYSSTQSNGDGYNYRLVYAHNDIDDLRRVKNDLGINDCSRSVNPAYEALKKIGIACKSNSKGIPLEYMYSSFEQRMELLKGLMDTDGSISKDGDIDYCTNSKQLADDFANLVRSLGIHCSYNEKITANTCYRIYLHTSKDVFHLSRKLVRIRKQTKNTTYTAITSITKLDYQEEQQCIEVDSDDHLYLTDGYTPTHNSYKSACGAVWITAFRKKAKVLIASAQGSDATLCFEKAMDIIDHISKYTPFGRENPGKPADNGGWKYENMSLQKDSGNFIFGLYNTRTGEKAGRQSEISTASLYNKADAASGEGLSRLYFEEGGKISNLGDAWTFSRESMRVGSVYRDGIAILFGTGGEMVANSGKSGSSKDFSIIHNNPGPAGFAAFDNIYDYKASENKCGYFVSDMWYHPGSTVTVNGKVYEGIDKQGNACFWVAELALNVERIGKMPPNGKKRAYEAFLTQRCKTPGEAFLITLGSRFQTEDLYQRQTDILTSRGGFEQLRMPGELVELDLRTEFIPKYDLEPITTTGVDNNDREGCLIRYEPPQKINGVVPEGAYIISCDPIGIDTSSGKSCSAIIVLKTSKYASWIGEEKIVATYYGRKKINPQEYVNRLLLKLSKYYNARITFENDRDGGIPQYFMRKGETDRLMGPPLTTMEKYIPGTKTNLRRFGHSMGSSAHKTVGEDLLYEWLDIRNGAATYYDTDSGEEVRREGLRNLDRIQDQLLLEQLQSYNRDGNYDMVMAMMGIVVQLKEWYDVEDSYTDNENVSDELSDWFDRRYMSNDEYNASKQQKNSKKLKLNKTTEEDDY